MVAMGLRLEKVFLGYGNKVVVRGISFEVREGEIVALLGHNGAGKTTALKGIMGLLRPYQGTILFYGENKTDWPAKDNVGRGIAYVPQGSGLFPDLTVAYNLELASHTVGDPSVVKSRQAEAFRLFPVLETRKWQTSRTLSGGEQRMLSVAMALMTKPKLLMMDEPSLGLAPLLVEHLMEAVRAINTDMETAVLLVEQNVKQALATAGRAYVMKVGQIILEENTQTLRERQHLWELF
jgi:branched-chain amino acid transport system ATP-binding protein